MRSSLKPVELFLALGLTATVAACGGPAADTTTDTVEETPMEQVSPEAEGGEAAEEAEETEATEGGEGGEGGEG